MATKKPKETNPPKKPKSSINAGEKRDMDSQNKAQWAAGASEREYYAERARDSADYTIWDRDLGGGIGDTVYTPRNPYGASNRGLGARALRMFSENRQDYAADRVEESQRKKKALSYANTQKPSKKTAKSTKKSTKR